MRVRREIGLSLFALLGIAMVSAASSIVLLQRMAPAIGRILDDNVVSEEAALEMMALVAVGDGEDDRERRFAAALDRAKRNLTESEEPAILEDIHDNAAAALRGEPRPRQRTIDALRRLSVVNRASMQRADADARRMGLAGAWAAALLGGASLVLGVFLYRRLRLRFEIPLDGLRTVLERARTGDNQVRCHRHDAPSEIAQVTTHVDALLDRLQEAAQRGQSPTALPPRALVEAMDRVSTPLALEDDAGVVVAKNAAALDVDDDVIRAWPFTPVAASRHRWRHPKASSSDAQGAPTAP
jgi:hypothetical protein